MTITGLLMALAGGSSSAFRDKALAPRWRVSAGARVTVALFAPVATVVLLCVTAAGAAVTHKPLFQLGEIPAKAPGGEAVAFPGPLGHMESMTVDSGHLWVAEGSQHKPSRVDVFDAKTGAFIGQPIHLPITPEAERQLPTCDGEACGEGIAVGHRFGEAEVYVGGESQGKSVVSIFDEAGARKATWSGASAPGGSFGITAGVSGIGAEGEPREYNGPKQGTVTAVAVDNSTSPLDSGAGNVYVAVSKVAPESSRAFEEIHVIDVFHPEANGEERYVGQITGTSASEPFRFIQGITVEPNGDLLVNNFLAAGDTRRSVIDVFEPTVTPGGYTFVGKMSGPPPTGVFGSVEAMAVDALAGDVYVADASPEGYRIEQFNSTGTYLGNIQNIPDAFAIAIDPSSHDLYASNVVYGQDIVTPDVTTAAVTSLKPESVTLNGTVNPDGAGPVTCEFEWGTSESFGRTAPCSEVIGNGEAPVAVHVALTGLERDQTYYYRLRASNANGTNAGERWQIMQFTTHAVLVREDFVSDVSATSVTFGAKIDPGGTPTSYRFQYGTSAEYGQQAPAEQGEAVGSGESDVVVPGQHVQGLSAGSTYHYRVVAVSEIAPGEFETVYTPDHTFTTQPAGGAFALTDGRQWQLVSPPDKLGAPIEGLEGSVQAEGAVQASAGGGAIAYRSGAPTEAVPSGFAVAMTVFSARGPNGWSSLDISAPHDHAAHVIGSTGNEYQIFSEDLSHAALQPADSTFTALSPQATEQTPYLRSDFTSANGLCSQSCYRPLVTALPGFADVPPGTAFGEEPNGVCEASLCGPQFAGASPDLSHIVLSSPAQLTSTPAQTGGPGLYEWSNGNLQLVGVLPEGESGSAVLAGSGHLETGVRHAVSENGERVIMEGRHGDNGLYVREVGAGETVRLDVPQGGAGPSASLTYETASADASRIFFLDTGRLTAQSSASGEDLYEYDLNAPAGSRLTDLTADPNVGEAAAVAQVIGASEDGSYVYFVAAGALTPAAPGGPNLYVSHEGHISLIATLSSQDAALYDWKGVSERQFARISPNGHWLAFMSSSELTGYDTHDAVSGHPDAEVYLYDAASDKLACASCNPTGGRPAGLDRNGNSVAARVPRWRGPPHNFGSSALRQPRYLSDAGRLFFDSADALIPQDVNGTEDVYEYEPVGVGDCIASSATFVRSSSGCLDLVSAGISPVNSEFLDASETGGDVFFITRTRLAPQDYDSAYDVYDAHECTGSAPCLPVTVTPPPCQTEASCRAAPSPQPALYGTPASATFSGVGNFAAEPSSGVRPKARPSKRRPLAAALKACRRKRDRHKRARCEQTANAKYASVGKTKKSIGRSK